VSVAVEVAGAVATVSVDNPPVNALDDQTLEALGDTARSLAVRDDVRAVVLTGAGERAFCAGFDLDDAEGLSSLSPMGMLTQQELAARGLSALRALPMPVIAAVNGAATGGGLALALAADIRIGSPKARFNAAFVRIGLSAGDLGTSWLLPRLIGPARTAEFCYTGRFMEAGEAERVGLLNRVVPADELLDATLELAGQIASNSPGGVQLSKRALQANMEAGSYAAALELENRGQALLTRGSDFTEALSAFKEKRAPRFTGA